MPITHWPLVGVSDKSLPFLLRAWVMAELAAVLTNVCPCWYRFCCHRFVSRSRKTPGSTGSTGGNSTVGVGFANNQSIGRVQEFCIGHNLKREKVVMGVGEIYWKAYFLTSRIFQIRVPQSLDLGVEMLELWDRRKGKVGWGVPCLHNFKMKCCRRFGGMAKKMQESRVKLWHYKFN